MVVVVISVAVLQTACKNKDSPSQEGLEGPCAAERQAAADAWDRVGYDLASMRQGIIAETVSLELNEHAKLTHALVNSAECAGMIGLFDSLVAAKDKPRWRKCNEDSQAMSQVEDQMRRLMHDKAGLKAKQEAASKEARTLAARYRGGVVPEGDAKRVYDRLLVFYGAASRVQSTGPQCIGNDCLSTSAAAQIQYDIRPTEAAMKAANAACPKVADTTAPPPAPNQPPTPGGDSPPQQPLDEQQGEQGGDEPCTPRLVLDPAPKGTGGNLRNAPNGDILMEVPNCTEVCEIEADGDWRRVRASPRDVGYMHKSQLAAMNAARCKAGAPTPAPKKATLPKQRPSKKEPPPPPATVDPFQ